MGISAISQSSAWPQFWIGGPLVLMICGFILVAVITVIRAHPEDLPKVLAILASVFILLAARLRAISDEPRPPGLKREDDSSHRNSKE